MNYIPSFDYNNFIFGILITIGISIIFFLIMRNVNLWYWKVNKIVSLLEEINGKSKKKETSQDNTEIKN